MAGPTAPWSLRTGSPMPPPPPPRGGGGGRHGGYTACTRTPPNVPPKFVSELNGYLKCFCSGPVGKGYIIHVANS